MPNRVQAPKIQEIEDLKLPRPHIATLDNGIPVYAIQMGTQEVLKLEIIFNAGRPYESANLVSRATASLMKEGTLSKSSNDIAELIDFYGGSISVPVNLDTSNILLYSIKKYFGRLLPLVAEILTEPTFPEKELKTFKDRNVQRLMVDLSRNDVVAYRKVTELIFGSDHPYGYNSVPKTYKQITPEQLKAHYQNNFTADNCKIIISGKVDDEVLSQLNHYLGSILMRKGPGLMVPAAVQYQKTREEFSIPGSVQSAIRIGRHLFNRHHEDFKDLFVLNTIFGGYFGSRLMANIREEKGYTYNIYSALDVMVHDGCFYVGTEVGNEFVEATIQEVFKEMKVLQEKLVDKDELEMVQNYLLGNLLTSLDGPFNVSEIIKTIVTEDLPFDHFEKGVAAVKNITAERLQELAVKYLKPDEMSIVVVGN